MNNNRWFWRLRFGYANVNLLEYSSNYSEKTGSLLFYSKDEAYNFANATENDNDFKSFKYKTKLIGSTAAANGILKDVAIAVSLKYLSDFGDHLKCHWLIVKLNWNLEGQRIVF